MGLDSFLSRAAEQDAEWAAEQLNAQITPKEKSLAKEKKLLESRDLRNIAVGLEIKRVRLLIEESSSEELEEVESLLVGVYEQIQNKAKPYLENLIELSVEKEQLENKIKEYEVKLRKMEDRLFDIKTDIESNISEVCYKSGEGHPFDKWYYHKTSLSEYYRDCPICGKEDRYSDILYDAKGPRNIKPALRLIKQSPWEQKTRTTRKKPKIGFL